ncbi:hypothetical protein [Iamia sp.]|nr:hypothetical protein [Iamia sp.]HXH57581.1 hypothetical protein [Iamia sp.]
MDAFDIATAFDKLGRLGDDELPCDHREVPGLLIGSPGGPPTLLQDDS